jgi:hypothetical protein
MLTFVDVPDGSAFLQTGLLVATAEEVNQPLDDGHLRSLVEDERRERQHPKCCPGELPSLPRRSAPDDPPPGRPPLPPLATGWQVATLGVARESGRRPWEWIMSVAVSRVLLGRSLVASLCAAAVILAGVHSGSLIRDGRDSGIVRMAADGCAHCPNDIPPWR